MDVEPDAEETPLLDRLRAAPNDDEARLVYADYLEERGRTAQSEFLRLQVELKSTGPDQPPFAAASARLRELTAQLDVAWRRVVATVPIEGCDELRFDFACPKRWSSLTPTPLNDAVRFCDSCQQNVHYCVSMVEASEHARAGRCVVIDPSVLRWPGDLTQPPMPVPPPGMMPLGGAYVPQDPPPPPKKKRGLLRRLFRRGS